MFRVSELLNADVSDLIGPDGAGRYSLTVTINGAVPAPDPDRPTRGSGRAAPGARGVRQPRVSTWWRALKGYMNVMLALVALMVLLKLMAMVAGWLGL